MKKIFFVLIFLVSCLTAHGQKLVVQGEYFWDADPGVGNGIAVVANDGNFDTAIENILKNGIDVTLLSTGAHSFNVRVFGQDGSWSSVFKQTIYIQPAQTIVTRSVNVVMGEYFWDTDPGVGNGTPVIALDGNFNTSVENILSSGISVASLGVGAHSFNVRVKGFDNSWGAVFKQTIFVESTASVVTRTVNVVQGEYFWDTDPGVGNGTVVLAVDGNFSSTLEHLMNSGITVSSLSVGAHSFNVRVKGNNGSWSALFKQTIAVETTPVAVTRTVHITQGEYYWDTDPGVGNGTAILALDGNFNAALEQVLQNGIDVSTLPLGAHSLSVRVKGNNGSWSTVFKQTIYLEGALVSVSRSVRLQQAEYFWDTDPGVGNGTMILATDGNFDFALENLLNSAIDVSSLSLGAHSFQVRVKGQDNSWSAVFKQTIFIECATPTPAAISISSTQNGQCVGSQNVFTATATNGGNNPIYTWKVNGIVVGTNSSTLTINTLNNGDIVTCELVSNSTCASPNTAVSNSIPVNLQPIITPTISISSSAGSSICTGTTVTYSATVTNGGGSAQYQWEINGVNVGTNSSVFTSSTLNNGDIVSCQLTSSLACTSPSVVVSNTITMSVSNIVTPFVSISASNSAICQGTTVSFTANATNGGASPVYQWKVNGINVGGNSTIYSSSSLQNGDVVSCVLTSSLTCVTIPNATSNAVTMTVSPSVAASVSISSSNGTTICQGTTNTFTAVATNGGTFPVYQWTLNGFNVGLNQSTYSTASLSNGDVVTCNMTSSESCPTPLTSVSNAITMTVNSSAPPTISISSNLGTSICDGSSVVFSSSITNGGSSPSYQWLVNGLPVGTNNASYSSNSIVQGDVVACVVTSNASCINGQTATSNNLSFTVTSIVTPSITINASASTICANASVSFTANPTNGGTTPNYQWKVNGFDVGSNSSIFTSSSLQNGDVVSCVLNSSLPCISSVSVSSNSITMTVIPSVSTSVSISSSGGTIICQGVTVVFTASPTNGGPSPSYQWQLNGSNVGTNSPNYSTSSLSSGDIVTCYMTSSASCPSPATSVSNSISMTVNSSAAPTLAISSAQGTSICAGTSVFFTATETNGGSSPNYQWKINGTNVGPNSAFFNTNTLIQGDIVTCVVTSNATCVNGQTATSNALIFNVTTNVSPSIVIGTSSTTLCQGANATFTASPTNGGSTPSYQWKINGINVGTNSASFSSTSLQNGDIVTCVLGSSLSCVTNLAVTSNSITMTINAYLPVSVSIVSSVGSSTCQGTTVNFTATPVNGGTSPSYQWQVNGFNVGSNSVNYSTSALANGDVVSCILTSDAPCPSPVSASSNSITMTVNAVTPPTVTISSNQGTTICAGTSVIFTAAETNGGSSPSFQWKVNGMNVGSNQPFYSSSSLAQGDIVTCVVTSNANCVNGQTATSNALIFTVTSIATPSVTIASSTTTICQGSLASFTATPNFGGSTPSYQWLVNGNPSGTNSSAFSSASLQNGDVISCILTSSYACVTASTATSNSLSMTVNPSVAASVSISSNNGTTICQGTPTVFTASPINGGANPSYQWQINGSTVGTNSSTFSSSSLVNGDIVTCYMTSSAACPVPALSTSNSITMTVNSLITPTVVIAASELMPVCIGSVVSFSATTTDGGTTPSYQWKVNGNNAGTNSPTFNPAGLTSGDVVSCVITSNAQCLSTPTATSNSIAFQETSIDVGVTQTTSTLTSNQSAASYQWINCTTMAPIAGQIQQSYTPSVSGEYAVQVTIGSCVDTSTCVQMTVVGIDEETTSLFKIYPNPASGFVYISAPTNNPIEVYCLDVTGRLVKSWNLSSTTNALSIDGLATGSYYFQVIQDQRMEVFQVSIIFQ